FRNTTGMATTVSGSHTSGNGILEGNPLDTIQFRYVDPQDSSDYRLININPPTLTISPTALQNTDVGAVLVEPTLIGLGGFTPYTFAVASGALPAGVSLSSGGVFSGTPTASGTFNFSIQAMDNYNFNVTQNYSIVVIPAATTTVSANATTPY